MTQRKKLIEVSFPLDAINKEAAREKSIRHGHPGTLHLWWARRPLAACRAVLFASLVDDPSSRPDDFVLAIVEVDGDNVSTPGYVRRPFQRQADFGLTNVHDELRELIGRAGVPS